MKINGTIKGCTVITKKEMNGVKDPSKKYYKLGIVNGDELGEVSCTDVLFGNVDKGGTYDLLFTYNSEFNSFILNGLNKPTR